MRRKVRAGLLAVGTAFLILRVEAAGIIPTFSPADLVLGQPDFSAGVEEPPPTATSLNEPAGIAIDPVSGKVFVTDTDNTRVLRYPNFATLSSGAAAEAVFGQSDFTSTDFVELNEKSVDGSGLTVDSSGNLWIGDVDHGRVLMIPNAATAGNLPSATKVFGQPNFTSSGFSNTASGMNNPVAVAVDAEGNLYVSDTSNHRVTRFDNALAKPDGSAANAVFGQAGFNVSTPAAGASGLDGPVGCAIGADDFLWVADSGNNRVLGYVNASTASSPAAVIVLGQLDFAANAADTTERSMSRPTDVFEDADGTLWVLDTGNNRVLAFRNARSKGNGGSADVVLGQENFNTATASAGRRGLSNPFGEIVGDPTGAVWLTDLGNDRVLRFSPDEKAPVVRIKGGAVQSSSRAKFTLRGTAKDAVGIEEVRFKTRGARAQVARGREKWNARLKLAAGRNAVRVFAIDTAENKSKPVCAVIVRE